jgi:PcfJ-like protein
MGHCVGSYARSCASGRVSIWTLKVIDALCREERLLTLEVTNHGRQIVQARRKYNKMPDPKELSYLISGSVSAQTSACYSGSSHTAFD